MNLQNVAEWVNRRAEIEAFQCRFYILKLEPAPNNTLIATNIKLEDNKYKVKKI